MKEMKLVIQLVFPQSHDILETHPIEKLFPLIQVGNDEKLLIFHLLGIFLDSQKWLIYLMIPYF